MGTRARGRFVVLEGMDGAGTTTQARALAGLLTGRGREALYTREPSDGAVGAYIRCILRGEVDHPVSERTLAALFAADRLAHLDAEIGPALARGVDVVCDRYTLSSLAYQGVMTGDPEWVRQLNTHAREPDLTVLLDVPEDEALRRRSGRGEQPERYEVDATQRAVATAYRRLADDAGAIVLDGTWDPARLTASVLEALEGLEETA